MKFLKITDGQIFLEDNTEEVVILIENIIRLESSTELSKGSYKAHQFLLIFIAIVFFPTGLFSIFFSEDGVLLGTELLFVGFGGCFYVYELYIKGVGKNFDTDNHTITLVVKSMNAANPIRVDMEVGTYENTQSLKEEIITLINKDALKKK
jgi:hypothetical protein